MSAPAAPAPALVVATRQSRLALVQVDEALALLRPLFPPDTLFTRTETATPGDRDLATALTDPSVPDDFFTRDLDRMLLDGRADLAVHSAKDLPREPVPGLAAAALLPARDIREALVLRAGVTEASLRTIGSSSPRRLEEIRRHYPHAEPRPIRGTIEDRLRQLDAGAYDAVIMAACALDRLGLTHRISAYLPFEPVPQQGRLALVVRADRHDLLRTLRAVDVRRAAGLVALVGCPASRDLLARRAEAYLRAADVVIHDRLVPPEALALARGRLIEAGKTGGGPSTCQADIHRLLLYEAERGQLVVRLHGGDPGIYGHLGEELAFLSAWNLRCDVVPAITAAQVAAADARAPLTHRGDGHRVTLVTARPCTGCDVPVLPGPDAGNLAVYMGVRAAPRVGERLRESGWPVDTPLVIGERLGAPDEQLHHTTVAGLATAATATPAVFLAGPRPVAGAPWTLFTGTEPDQFLRHGPLLPFPVIGLEAEPLARRAETLACELASCRGILFPSRFAVRCFVEALLARADARALHGKVLLAVGPATEEALREAGLRADAAADDYGGVRALAGKLSADLAGRYLYPCSDAAPRAERAAALLAHGIELAPALFYRNCALPRRELPRLPFDRVLFTSGSTVDTYFRHHPDERTQPRRWLAVGPATLRALEAIGLDAERIAR